MMQLDSASRFDRYSYLEVGLAGEHLVADTLGVDQFARLAEWGIDGLMYIAGDQDPAGAGDCSPGGIRGLIADQGNRVTAGKLFMTPGAGGCGIKMAWSESGVTVIGTVPDSRLLTEPMAIDRIPVMMWARGAEPLTGRIQPAPYDADGNTAYLALGIGPSLSLFDPESLAHLSELPEYPFGASTAYRRFMAVFAIGRYRDGAIVMHDRPQLAGVVGAKGETAQEVEGEGEWDGDRSTI